MKKSHIVSLSPAFYINNSMQINEITACLEDLPIGCLMEVNWFQPNTFLHLDARGRFKKSVKKDNLLTDDIYMTQCKGITFCVCDGSSFKIWLRFFQGTFGY